MVSFDPSARIFKRSLVACAIAAACNFPQIAFANDDDSESEDGKDKEEYRNIERIVVTARNREELANKIPVAINTFSSEELERQSVVDISEIITRTPGLTYDSFGSMATGSPVIRGLGQPGLVGDETNVAVFIDGIYASGRDAAFLPLSGIERVEVVKGPQSALYGRNAFAGAINYITKKPTKQFVGGLDFTAGQYGRAQGAFYASSGLTEALSMRFDISSDETGSTFNDPDEGYEMGSSQSNFGRIRLRYEPTEWLRADMTHTQIDMTQTVRPTAELASNAGFKLSIPRILAPFQDALPDPSDPAHQFFPNPDGKWLLAEGKSITSMPQRYVGKVGNRAIDGAPSAADGTNREVQRSSITLDFLAEDFTVNYLFGQNETNYTIVTGQSINHTGFLFVPMPIAGFIPFTDNNGDGRHDPQVVPVTGVDIGGQPNDDRKESSHELRISGGEDALLWSFGGFYSDIELRQWSWNSIVEPADPLSAAVIETMGLGLENGSPRLLQSTDHTTETVSAFFSLGYDINMDWNVTLEGRWTEEEKTADNNVDNRAPGILFPTGFMMGKWSYFTPRLTVDYDYNVDTLFYLNIGNGVKSGGINGGADPSESTFDPEENWTYEVGAKTSLLDGDLRLNLSAYYIDWTDQQIRDFSNVTATGTLPGIIVTNLGRTEVTGFEIDARLQITQGFSTGLALNYSDNEITEGRIGPDFGYLDYEALGMSGVPFPGVSCVPVAGFSPACVDLPDSTTLVSDGNVAGNQLPRTSKLTANLNFDYVRNIGPFNFYTIWSNGFRSKQYMDIINQIEIGSRVDSQLVMGIETRNWRTSLWVNNLFDNDTPLTAYRKFLFSAEPQTVMEPNNGRTVGVSFMHRL